jgi:hypothetical protein
MISLRKAAFASSLLLAGTGCSSAGFSGEDVRLHAQGDTLYVMARSGNVSRNLCSSLGGDVARAEGRWAADEGRTIQTGRVAGCFTTRHIIVCSEEDAACVAHEERHRTEGAFHR